MRRTGMKRRTEPMKRTEFPRPSLTVVRDINSAPRRKPVKPVSTKRARENRERTAMADRLWPGRRDGTVMCVVPGPVHPADDLHEPKTRARGGSITDENNAQPLCRQHNDDLSQRPESELGWAYDLGLLKHSWDNDSPSGDAA